MANYLRKKFSFMMYPLSRVHPLQMDGVRWTTTMPIARLILKYVG